MVFMFYDLCENLWGGSPAVTNLENGIDTSGNSEQPCEDSEYDQQSGSKGNCSSSISSSSSHPDEPNEGEENQNTNDDRRKKITEFLNKRKDLKLATKTRSDKRKVNCVEEEIQLKKQLIERMDKNDREFQENFEKVNKTMETIGQSIQQSVGLLAKILRSRAQPNFYPINNMLQYPGNSQYQRHLTQNNNTDNELMSPTRGFHYPSQQSRNINTNDEMGTKNFENSYH